MAEEKRLRQGTIKFCVFDVLPDALEEYRQEQEDNPNPVIRARRLYYKVRKRYLNHPQRPRHKETVSLVTGQPRGIQYHYFTTNLLPDYERRYGKIENLARDVRGHLYEPHTKIYTELNTVNVRDFEAPVERYNKILYIEKEGQLDDILPNRLAERFDMALIGGKGYATEAARDLLALFDGSRSYSIFVLHDADPYGYNIARTLAEETQRMPDHHIDIFDIGLTLADGEALGGDTEPFTREVELPQRIIPHLTEQELRMFTGVRTGKKSWEGLRIELDSVGVSSLISFVEERILETGAVQKVWPSEDVLASRMEDWRDKDIEAEVGMAIAEIVDHEAITEIMLAAFKDRYDVDQAEYWIRIGYARDVHDSWRAVVKS